MFTLFVYIFLLGFGGKRCQEKIDLCASAGCVNGACVDKLFRYECVCQPGWTGDMCDVNIDDCDPNPCANNGQCIDDINDFVCDCEQGFTGKINQLINQIFNQTIN